MKDTCCFVLKHIFWLYYYVSTFFYFFRTPEVGGEFFAAVSPVICQDSTRPNGAEADLLQLLAGRRGRAGGGGVCFVLLRVSGSTPNEHHQGAPSLKTSPKKGGLNSCWIFSQGCLRYFRWLWLLSALSHPFFGWEGSPTNRQQKKRNGTLILTSLYIGGPSQGAPSLKTKAGGGLKSWFLGFPPGLLEV